MVLATSKLPISQTILNLINLLDSSEQWARAWLLRTFLAVACIHKLTPTRRRAIPCELGGSNIYECSCIFMNTEYLWISFSQIRSDSWIFMNIQASWIFYEYISEIFMIHEYSWMFMATCGPTRITCDQIRKYSLSLNMHEYIMNIFEKIQWIFINIHGLNHHEYVLNIFEKIQRIFINIHRYYHR